MDSLERAKLLKAMLSQIAPKNNIESIPVPMRASSLEGLESLPEEDPTAKSGMQKMVEDRVHEVTSEESDVLEAIVLPALRPAVFVRGNSYDPVGDSWERLNTAEARTRIAAVIPSIGRIELPNSMRVPYGGTSFVVGKGLLMTNRHVAKLFSEGVGLRVQYHAGDAGVNFKKEVDLPNDKSTYLEVRGVLMVHPYWDMALLQVDGNLPAPLKLSTKSPNDLLNRDVVVIGYPAQDTRSDFALQQKIFGGVFNVKRLQPGVLRPRLSVNSFGKDVSALTHDASTLGGNSGSAVIDAMTGEVLALHFAGEYLKANYAVPMYELARDSRVAPKLNFDGSAAPTNDFEPAWRSTEPKAEAPQTASVQPSPAPIAPLQSPVPAASQAATWTIPLQISISIGSPAGPAVLTVGSPQVQAKVEGEEKVEVDQDYTGRPGYLQDFLDGVTVPLPSLSAAMKKDTAEVDPDFRTNDDPHELAYYHYSVYMCKSRRTAWFSAANIDGKKRPKIGPREGDRWYIDTRISRDEQMGQEAYEHGIDRGHLTRRDDTAWGDDADEAKKANDDTFHFTNCSLQAAQFNRGKDRWQGLEQFLLEQHAKKDKRCMTVITGPLFSPKDPVYKNAKMKYSVRCPLEYWKVCVLVRESDGTPSATGFILGQPEIKELDGFEEAFDVSATQIKIADLEKRTGLSFGDLKKFDHFAKSHETGALESVGAVEIAIHSDRDIVV